MWREMRDTREPLRPRFACPAFPAGEAGAGLVRATATAKGELKALSIDPSLFKAEEREVVEDLIVAAVQDAQARAQATAAEEMGRVTEGLGLPPGMKLPF
jgi:DNA-binding YbaB/EbfC family protein